MRTRNLLIATLLSALLTAVWSSPASASLLSDPGFESGGFASGWVAAPDAGVETFAKETGDFGLWLKAFVSGSTAATQTVAATAGTEYKFSMNLLWESNYNNQPAGQPDLAVTELKFEWLDAANAQISADVLAITPTIDGSFHTAMIQAIAPVNTTQVRVVVLSFDPDGNGGGNVSAFADNASLNVVPEPASLALLSAGALLMLRRRRTA